MPTSLSSAKRVRQNAKRKLLNKQKISAVKTTTKKLEAAIKSGDAKVTAALLNEAYQRIDKAAARRALHPNTAARRKALLARHAAKLAKS
ncbi:MAG: 30S ribosomal protein S20 [Planctomycetota bacterium]